MLLYHNVAELRQIKGAEYRLCDPSAMQGRTSELRGSEGKLASIFKRPREIPEYQGRESSCAAYCGSPREDLRPGSGCRGSRPELPTIAGAQSPATRGDTGREAALARQSLQNTRRDGVQPQRKGHRWTSAHRPRRTCRAGTTRNR